MKTAFGFCIIKGCNDCSYKYNPCKPGHLPRKGICHCNTLEKKFEMDFK